MAILLYLVILGHEPTSSLNNTSVRPDYTWFLTTFYPLKIPEGNSIPRPLSNVHSQFPPTEKKMDANERCPVIR